jgi:serine/threonine-protein kinase HipA
MDPVRSSPNDTLYTAQEVQLRLAERLRERRLRLGWMQSTLASPAFDLIWSHGPGGEHSTSVAGVGRDPGIEQVRTLARQFGVRPAELELLRAAVNDAISGWAGFAEEAGCRASLRAEVARHLRAI